MIEVAEPILRHSQVLTAAELDAVVRDFGLSHAAVIAQRREAMRQGSEGSRPRLPETKSPTCRRTQDEAVARDLDLAELFFSAEFAERRMLLMSLGARRGREAAGRSADRDDPRARNRCAWARPRRRSSRLIESALGLTHAQAERIVSDPSGEPLLVAAKALAMPSVTLQRILMFIDPAIGESVQRVFDLAGLYERLSADAAHKIVASLRGARVRRAARRPAHRPMYYDDEAARSRRGSAIRRPPPRAERQAPARVETGDASAHDVIEEVPPGRDPRPRRSRDRDRSEAGAPDRPRCPLRARAAPQAMG